MKNIIWILILVTGIIFESGCKKKSEHCGYTLSDVNGVVAPGSEVNALKQYIENDSIDATYDARGFYYKIESEGSAEKPAPCADITINYVGSLTSGSVFDQATNAQFNLSNLIVGWQIGVPLIGKGGKITLYLPPSFGYGSNQVGSIPANSILVFSIDLINFTNP